LACMSQINKHCDEMTCRQQERLSTGVRHPEECISISCLLAALSMGIEQR